MKRIPATAAHEDAFQGLCAEIRRQCEANPSLRTIELIAILGRTAGYCIAACHPNERDLARAVAVENLDRAVADVARNDLGNTQVHAT